jgi:hypothetical protein
MKMGKDSKKLIKIKIKTRATDIETKYIPILINDNKNLNLRTILWNPFFS